MTEQGGIRQIGGWLLLGWVGGKEAREPYITISKGLIIMMVLTYVWEKKKGIRRQDR